MKNLMTFFLLSSFIITTSFKNQIGKGYKIIGSVTGFPDSTLIYLDNITSGQFVDIDSTFIINGKFQFSGSLKEKALHAAIRTKDFSNRCHIWLENSTIYFNAEKGKFKDADIRGSKTQSDQDKLDSAIKASGNNYEQSKLFIRNHPSSIISAQILNSICTTWGKDSTTALYKSLSKEIKNTFYGKNVLEYITLNKNLKIGDKFVDFAEQNSKGKTSKLSDFKGKVVMLEFWGSWCGPCRARNPELVKIYNEFNSKGFEIFGVAAETNKGQWLGAIEDDKLPWTNVTDLKGDKNKAALIYSVTHYPTNILIDRTGTIIARDFTEEKLREKLKEIL